MADIKEPTQWEDNEQMIKQATGSNDLLGSCTWSQEDKDSDGWETDCGYNFEVYEGTPAENNMKFCCYCGKRLITELYKERT